MKQWYAAPDDRPEMRVDGYIIDLVRGDLLVEIQTGSFSPLKRKLAALAENHLVRLVFPIPQEKWILTLEDEGGRVLRKRKSPKRGQVEHVFTELVYIPDLILRPNFSLEVLLIREEELRRPVQKKHRRSKGWVTIERRLLEVVGQQVFHSASDLEALLPDSLPESFTVRELATAMHQPAWLVRKIVYCLRKIGTVRLVGKKSRANLYSKTTQTI